MKNPFFFKGKKPQNKLRINFIIIKSITIILVYVSRLSHTLIISFKGSNILLSPPRLFSRRRQPFALPSLAIFLKTAIPCTLLPLAFLPSKNLFSLSWFHALFSLSPWGGPTWAKAIKFFVTLSIY